MHLTIPGRNPADGRVGSLVQCDKSKKKRYALVYFLFLFFFANFHHFYVFW